MLIVSDFHDYYDSAMAHGVDKTCVYNRKTTPVDYEGKTHLHSDDRRGSIKVSQFLVGFCGVIYPATRIEGPLFDETFYNAESCIEFLKEQKIGLNERYWRFSFYQHSGIGNEKTIQGYYTRTDFKQYENLFLEHNVPIFSIGQNLPDIPYYKRVLVLSPQLKPIKFARVKDPFTAFQDIYMYKSGVLGAQPKPMVEIEDKYKQQQHGHDDKYSFRKPKGKRGNPKWR